MASPVVVIQKIADRETSSVLDASGKIAKGAYVFHLWSGISLQESIETQDNPNGSGGSFQIETRELPRTLSLVIDIAEDLILPSDGGGATYQTGTMEKQVAILRGLRNTKCRITTRAFAFDGVLKSVSIKDDGKWDNSDIKAQLTFQVISKGQFGLKTGPNGNLVLGSGSVTSTIISLAIERFEAEDDGNEDAPTGAGEQGEINAPPTVLDQPFYERWLPTPVESDFIGPLQQEQTRYTPSTFDTSQFNFRGSGTMNQSYAMRHAGVIR